MKKHCMIPLLGLMLSFSVLLLAGCGKSKPAGDPYTKGLVALEAGRFEEAVKNLQETLKTKPNDATVVLALGKAFFGLKDFTKAIEQFDKASKLDPKNTDAHLLTAESEVNLGRLAKDKKRDHQLAMAHFLKAERQCRAALEKNPKLAEGYYILSLVFEAREEDDNALGELDRALALKDTLVEAYLLKIKILRRAQKLADATAVCVKAKTVVTGRLNAGLEAAKGEQARKDVQRHADADLFRIDTALSGIQQDRGFYRESLDTLNSIISIAPNQTDAKRVRTTLAFLYIQERMPKEAEMQANKLQEIDQKWPQIAFIRGRVALLLYNTETDAAKKAELLNSAVTELSAFCAGRTSAEGSYWLGQAYHAKGRFDQALTEYGKALQNFPEAAHGFRADTHMRMASIRYERRSYPEAEVHCKRVLQYRPKYEEALSLLGTIYQMTGRSSEARQVLEEAWEAEPASPKANLRLAQIMLLRGQYSQAMEKCDAAIALGNNDDPSPHLWKGLVYLHMKQYHEAIGSFEQALRIKVDTPTAHVLLAQAHLENGQADKAIEVLKEYSRRNPGEADGPASLGRIYEQLGRTSDAIEAYKEALKINPKFAAAYSIGRLYLLGDRLAEAIDKWTEVVNISNAAQIPLPMYQMNLAFGLMLNSEPMKALKQVQDLKKNQTADQGNPFSLLEVFIYIYSGDFEKAQEVLEISSDSTDNSKIPTLQFIELCRANPINARNVLKSFIYCLVERNESRFAEAAKHMETAVRMMPDSLLLRTNLAVIYMLTNNRAKVEKECEHMIEVNPRYALPHYYLAQVSESEDEAIEQYELAVKKDEKANSWRLALAKLRLKRRQFDEAFKLAEEVLKQDDSNGEAHAIKATVFMERGEPDSAERAADRASKDEGVGRLIGKNIAIDLKMRAGRYDEAIAGCDEILKIRPEAIVFMRKKAMALARRGLPARGNETSDIDKAFKILNDARAVNDRYPDVYIDLSNLYRLDPRTLSSAIELLREGMGRLPNNVPLKVQLVNIYIQAGMVDDAEKLLAEIGERDEEQTVLSRAEMDLVKALRLKTLEEQRKMLDESENISALKTLAANLDPDKSFPANVMLGRLYLQIYDDTNAASKAFETARALRKENLEPYNWLAPIYFRDGLFSRATEVLAEAMKNGGSAARDAINTSRTAISQQCDKDLVAAERTARESLSRPPANDVSKLALANILVNAGKVEQAVEVMQKAVNMESEMVKAYENLIRNLPPESRSEVAIELNKAIYYLFSSWYDRIPDHYKQALEASKGNSIFIMMAWARSLVNVARYDEAVQVLKDVLEIRPDYISALTNLGDIYEALAKPADAIACYEQAAEKDTKNGTVMARLGDLYRANNRIPEAQKYYSRAIELKPDMHILLHRLGDTYEKQGLIDKALECYEKVIRMAPADRETSAAYNNAAWYHANKEKPDLRTALRYADKAKMLAPERPEVRDTFGWILYLSGRHKEARQELQTASMFLENNPSVQYHYAVVLAELNEKAEAIRRLESIINMDFAEKADAQKLNAKLKNIN
ncbi:MAG TPA: tetratricopeptide repeat protein [Planctomycetota bacterium]|nr:tetratricopeptide repeat protein [Planctomycetota bacterium]